MEFLDFLLANFPERIDSVASVSLFFRLEYATSRRVALADRSGTQGDVESALEQYRVLEQEYAGRIGSGTQFNATERDAVASTMRMFTVARLSLELAMGRFSNARKHLDRLEATYDRSKKAGRADYLRLAADYAAAIGDLEKAIDLRAQAYAITPAYLKRHSALRALHAMSTAGEQIFAGRFLDARVTLKNIRAVDMLQSGSVAKLLSAQLAYVSAELDPGIVATSDLDRHLNASKAWPQAVETLFVSGASVVVHYKNFQRGGGPSSLAIAVDSGHVFAKALRGIRAAGLNREIGFPPELLRKAKTAYLTAVVKSFGRNGVGHVELLDAASLYQESDTDREIAAAALRQKQVPGVSAADLRTLQDLLVATRVAQSNLGSTLKANDASASEVTVQSARATEAFQKLEVHVARLRKEAPSFGRALEATQAPSASELQTRLLPGEAILVFAPYEEGTLALLVSRDGITHRDLPLTLDQANAYARSIRRSVTFVNGQDVVPPFDTRSAAALHAELFGWAQPLLSRTRQIVVVSSGPLATIPFGLLLAGDPNGSDTRQMPWLIRRFAIGHSPSINAWLGTASGSAPRMGSFLAWADPDFGPTTPSLLSSNKGIRSGVRSLGVERVPELSPPAVPQSLANWLAPLSETRTEAESMARALRANPATDVLSGQRATRASVIAASRSGALATKSVVMFATHGLVPGQIPGLRQPALAMAREADPSNVPLLQLDDVMDLRMNADWVILSACSTSSADRVGGDALSGLARGFFFAGARSLLITHWEVHSESAAELTVRTMEKYASNRSMSRAQALQQASLDFVDSRNANPRWAHPAYWAAYALVGDGRR